VTVSGSVACERTFPAGVAGDELICIASYVTTLYTLFPTATGALTVHVNVPPVLEHAGLLVVRLVAIDAGVPVGGGLLLTLVSVMITDCVELETYLGKRVFAVAVLLGGGTEIVNCAFVACALVFAGGVALGVAGSVCMVLAPPQAVKAQKETSAMVRRNKDIPFMFIVIRSVRSQGLRRPRRSPRARACRRW
jgi:hypothetical protein